MGRDCELQKRRGCEWQVFIIKTMLLKQQWTIKMMRVQSSAQHTLKREKVNLYSVSVLQVSILFWFSNKPFECTFSVSSPWILLFHSHWKLSAQSSSIHLFSGLSESLLWLQPSLNLNFLTPYLSWASGLLFPILFWISPLSGLSDISKSRC